MTEKMTIFHDRCEERLIRYAKIDTQSANGVTCVPTTAKQFDLAKVLRDELIEIGVSDVWMDEEKCVVYGKIPSNLPEGKGMAFGYVAHMDTAPDASGTDVKPWVFRNYDGSDITLNKELGIVMKVEEFPNLKKYIGQDLVLTDGTTLLGGDDKASIAAIMTMAEYVCAHPEIRHGLISLAFTPDEEVGGLARDLDFNRFESKVAYTLDGDYCGDYQDETFNASAAHITFKGFSVHTGTAKNIMKNSVDMGVEFCNMLPAFEKPQYTEGREGFFHITGFNGSCEHTKVSLIVRDHDSIQFEHRNTYLQKCVDAINAKYGEGTAEMNLWIQYRNLKDVITQYPWMIDDLVQAIKECGVEPHTAPFRGGTDGSALSHRGLPCPNLSAGYENAHGRFEYVPVQSMEKNVEIMLKLNDIFASK